MKKITTPQVLAAVPAGCVTSIHKPKHDTPRGFVQNMNTLSTMYVAVVDETSRPRVSGDIMYRTAKNMLDYTGGMNMYCSVEELPAVLKKFLAPTD